MRSCINPRSMRRVTACSLVVAGALAFAPAAGARVLRVGSYHGIRGPYRTIQAAVNAAKPGDWVLVGPGDYKTKSFSAPSGASDHPAGVLITKAHLRLRGMNRNTVIVDGTKSGPACSRAQADQNFGPSSSNGPLGANGVMVWKANDVWVQNMTACNFLSGVGTGGNEIWWDGGDGSAQIGGWGFLGSYLNATSTYYQDEKTAAAYGIFSSNWSGGTWRNTYASNFNDSGYYIGACQQVCNQTVIGAWAEYSALGYSGSNSGGQLVVRNSQFDNNEDGFDTNSQNGDNPPPQTGSCPGGGTSPITHTTSCWVFMHNYVHDNNNPNVPAQGLSAEGPVGTGMSVSGGRNDTVMDNTFARNNAWGIIFVPFLDSGPPCTGGTMNAVGPGSCLYDEWGDALLNNTFVDNGAFGHPSNGDLGYQNFEPGHPRSCFNGNHEQNGGAIKPAGAALLQTTYPACNGLPPVGTQSSDPQFLTEVLCNAQVSLGAGPPACPNGQYPRFTRAVMHRLPTKQLKTMANPCAGVPKNAWCTRRKKA